NRNLVGQVDSGPGIIVRIHVKHRCGDWSDRQVDTDPAVTETRFTDRCADVPIDAVTGDMQDLAERGKTFAHPEAVIAADTHPPKATGREDQVSLEQGSDVIGDSSQGRAWDTRHEIVVSEVASATVDSEVNRVGP